MKKSTKVWLGIATIWPICWIFIFMALMLTLFLSVPPGANQLPNAFVFVFPIMFIVHFVTILGSLALMVYFIVNIFKTDRLEQNHKILWTVLLFFAGMLVMPVYWYLYIWRDAPTLSRASGVPAYLHQAETGNWTNQATAYERAPEGEYVPPPEPPNWRE